MIAAHVRVNAVDVVVSQAGREMVSRVGKALGSPGDRAMVSSLETERVKEVGRAKGP